MIGQCSWSPQLRSTHGHRLRSAGTLVLAIGTFVMARRTAEATMRAADASVSETTATVDLVALGREQLLQAHRPVVMAILGSLSVVANAPAGFQVPGDILVNVRVENVGGGPAFGVRLRIELLDQEGNPSVAPPAPQWPASRAGLGAGHELRLRFRAPPASASRSEIGLQEVCTEGRQAFAGCR